MVDPPQFIYQLYGLLLMLDEVTHMLFATIHRHYLDNNWQEMCENVSW
jgi:hypothetical protein